MADEELIALIERRFDELQMLLLDPQEQLPLLERGDHPVNDRLRRITEQIVKLEKRLDDVHPGVSTRTTLMFLEDRVEKAERAQRKLEQRMSEIESSLRSTSGREPTDSERPR